MTVIASIAVIFVATATLVTQFVRFLGWDDLGATCVIIAPPIVIATLGPYVASRRMPADARRHLLDAWYRALFWLFLPWSLSAVQLWLLLDLRISQVIQIEARTILGWFLWLHVASVVACAIAFVRAWSGRREPLTERTRRILRTSAGLTLAATAAVGVFVLVGIAGIGV